tara:strand:+ start:282 stop:1445 length:1164 start_codon:yes stop_codon:yes gene_type:complete
MPAKSKAQQKFMGMVHAYKKGEMKGSEASKDVKDAAKGMKKKSTKKYASTKHKDLPNKVKEERDYKAEYKKFQSSTKSKKYRAELNQYNRKKGTYGNGDGKDASHKGGKIVGFEKESTNRGRAEKSRLKKETLQKLVTKYGAKKVRETIIAVRPKAVTVSGNRMPEEPDFEYDPEKVTDEGFGGELKGKDKDKFEKARIENAEQLGYKATGSSDTKKQKLKMAHELKESTDKLVKALKKKLSDEGGAAGFKDLKDTAKKMGIDLTAGMVKKMSGISQHRDGDYILESVDEAPITSPSQQPYSSPEAQKMVEKDIVGMSKILGKASQMSIKKMMDGVKSGKYDAFDLQRAIMSGPVRDTSTGERDFMRVLWNKVRNGFRRYSKRGKLR